MDLALTDAQRDAIFKRLGLYVAVEADLREVFRRFLLDRVRILPEFWNVAGAGAVLSDLALTGVRIGENTDVDGVIYLRVFDSDPAPGSAKVRGYTSAADRTADAGAHIFTGSAADGATITLAAANSSGVSGTVLIGTVTANDSTPQARCLLDWKLHARNLLGGEVDDRLDFDADAFTIFKATCDAFAASIQGAIVSFATAMDDFLLTLVADQIRSGAANVATVSRTVASDGEVTLRQSGLLADLADDMEDNTGGSGEIEVLTYGLTASAVTFDGDNAGVGTMAAPTLLGTAIPGTVTARLVKAFDAAGREEFELTLKPSDGTAAIVGAGTLRVGATYRDPALGISSALLTRTFAKTGDGTNVHFAAATSVTSMTGETTGNTAAGQLTARVVANGAAWDFEFYKTTDTTQLTDANLVAKATAIATGAVFTATEQNGSGLEIAWRAGSAPVTANNVTLDIQQWEIVASGGRLTPDSFSWTVTLSATARGYFNDIIGKLRAITLNEDASPSVDDSFASANTVVQMLQVP